MTWTGAFPCPSVAIRNHAFCRNRRVARLLPSLPLLPAITVAGKYVRLDNPPGLCRHSAFRTCPARSQTLSRIHAGQVRAAVIQGLRNTPVEGVLTHHSSFIIHHSSFRIPHSPFRIPHSSFRIVFLLHPHPRHLIPSISSPSLDREADPGLAAGIQQGQ